MNRNQGYREPEPLSPLGSYRATMQHLQDVSNGLVPMQHPGAPKFRRGRPYITNSEEDAFSASSKKRLAVRALIVSWLGFTTPWILTFRRKGPEQFSQMFSSTPIMRTPVFRWSLIGGFAGLVIGERLYRPLIMKDGLKLRNSPMAKEARYMLWKMDPTHPLLLEDGVRELDDFEFEMQNQSRGTPLQKNKMSKKDVTTVSSDDVRLMEQKRRRFYEGRGETIDFSSEVFSSEFNPRDNFDHSDRFDLSEMFDSQPRGNLQL